MKIIRCIIQRNTYRDSDGRWTDYRWIRLVEREEQSGAKRYVVEATPIYTTAGRIPDVLPDSFFDASSETKNRQTAELHLHRAVCESASALLTTRGGLPICYQSGKELAR